MSDVFVLGLGKTGLLVSRFLLGCGERVFSADDFLVSESVPPDLIAHSRFHFIGRDQWKSIERHPFSEGVVSPGVPGDHVLITLLEGRGIRLISEIELASRYLSFPLIGITGSNGKSTTVSLVGSMFQAAGIPVFVGGNLGTPLIEACLSEKPYRWGVVEVSSFQLERTFTTRFHVAAILNIFPNHLDRHHTMRNYVFTKARIFNNQEHTDYSLLNLAHSSWHSLFARLSRSCLVPYSTRGHLAEGFFLDGRTIRETRFDQSFSLAHEPWKLPGSHNLENLLCAVAAARTCGLGYPVIEHSIRQFRGLPHRLEVAAQHNGILYINDSKSTTPASTRVAIESLPGSLVLLVGGRAKLRDFSELTTALNQGRVKAVILFGESSDLIKRFIPPHLQCYRVNDLEEAVSKALESACAGETVLLSPGCTSWDQYRNFEERGEHFRRLIHE